MTSGIPILRVAGIRIKAHWSVLLVALLLAWGFAEGIAPASISGVPFVVRWGLGVFGALLLIVSLTCHELAHAIVARRRGVEVEDITLWVFGGVSHVHDDWKTPGNELLVAVAGPLVSLLSAALFLGIAIGFNALGLPAIVVLLAEWLFGVNMLLLVFNLLPAFPLDGGRIVRAALWKLRRDRDWATRTAANVGRIFAFILIALGIADVFLYADPSGLWLAFIGWFLGSSARREQQGEAIRNLLHGVRVGDAMSRDPVRVPSWITVDLLFNQYVVRNNLTTFVTHGLDGNVEGLITLQAIRRVPVNQRTTKRASDIAVPVSAVPTATPADMLTELLARMNARTEGRALVFDQGQLVGVVAPADVARVISMIRPPRGGGMQPLPPPPPLPPAPETPTQRF